MGVKMEKIKNIIILAVEILLVIAIILFVTIYIAASSTERSYQKVLTLMNAKQYSRAASILTGIPHYKDSSELYVYIYPNDLYYKKYSTIEDNIAGYKTALAYIDSMKGELKTEKYRTGFNELRKTISFKIEEMNAKSQYDSMTALVSDGASLIKKGDYVGASEKLNLINNLNFEPVKKELLGYISLLNAVNLNNKTEINKSIGQLDPNYNGILSADISTVVLGYVDIISWNNLYSANISLNQTTSNAALSIGMKRNEVIGIMGEPTQDDIISNHYGKFEKMIYPNNRLVYLENDIVDTIK